MVALVTIGAACSCGAAAPTGPSFSCTSVEPNSVEHMICNDAGLSALDRKLADVYSEASKRAVATHSADLEASQRGWIKGRDECWKSDDKHGCVQQEYQRRIAELQIGYGLVPGTPPVTYRCDDKSEVVATYFKDTDPPTLIARRGDSVSLMYVQRSASGAKYQGRNETLWEHQGEALITWGAGAPEMHCKKATP